MMTSQMTDQHKEEALSRAFVHAIAARAGAIVSIWDFDYGIDGSFNEIAIIDGQRVAAGVTIHCQLKASKNCNVNTTDVIYELEAGAYNRLVAVTNRSTVPCILLLLSLPSDPGQWFEICEDYLQLRKCCYWMFWQETVPTQNSQSKSIHIPRSQHFTPETLNSLFQQFSRG